MFLRPWDLFKMFPHSSREHELAGSNFNINFNFLFTYRYFIKIPRLSFCLYLSQGIFLLSDA